MKVKVLVEFHDKDDFSKVYSVGEVYDFDDARANDILERGLALAEKEIMKVEEPVAETEATAETEVDAEGEETESKRGRKRK